MIFYTFAQKALLHIQCQQSFCDASYFNIILDVDVAESKVLLSRGGINDRYSLFYLFLNGV